MATAAVGAPAGSDFEIGSISKGITGLLYADAVARGEVGPDTTLGDVLPLGGSAAGGVSLASIGSHRSGLPRLPRSVQPWRRTLDLWRHGANPYREDLAGLLDQARGVQVGAPRPRYSNLAFELLGHALAAAAATTYPELVRRRIAVPLGLDPFYVPRSVAELRPTAVAGRGRRGGHRDPWVSEALGPAGGIRAGAEAMGRLGAALLAGQAPGLTALDPSLPFGRGAQLGMAWLTVTVRGRTMAA